jgi:hypothetical protein
MNSTIGVMLIVLLGVPLLSIIYVGYWLQVAAAAITGCPVSNGTTFDFLIVGGGTSGSVVAARL